ncbi:MAG TPA: hypothetical protein VMS37_03395 [Verrucomicrobiae bacterium]|nr:hypothetical protein [Verrucomicrobiae bacterium]
MWSRILSLIVVSASALAQTPTIETNQQLLVELKGIRTALEKIEKNQRVLVGLASLQRDENRAALLEAQRAQLVAQVERVNQEFSRASAAARDEESHALPTAMETSPGGTARLVQPAGASPTKERAAELARQLEELHRNLEPLEQSIRELMRRIAAGEKDLETLR